MKRFASLYMELDATTSTSRKCDALVRYLREAPPADAAWALYFLSGGRQKRIVPTALLRQAALELSGIPDWLFEQCYQTVGDLAETIAHLLPAAEHVMEIGLAEFIETRLLPLRGQSAEQVLVQVQALWMHMSAQQRFLFVKWVGGGFRVGVSRALVTRALALHSGLEATDIAQRMVAFCASTRQPTADDVERLLAPQDSQNQEVRLHPYPFFLAHPLSQSIEEIGPLDTWLAEWKYDGIRAQIVRRSGQMAVWSRGEELINDSFPELMEIAPHLPDGCVLDGEILIELTEGDVVRIGSFADLQTRLGRKRVDGKLRRSHPAIFMAYDLLQWQGQDIRHLPQRQRRGLLEGCFSELAPHASALRISPLLSAESSSGLAALRQDARRRGVEGLMLKHQDAQYGVGRTKTTGVWWKWKLDPMSVDAVLVYAQAGHGRRANLMTDYTFAVWDRTPDENEIRLVCESIAKREPVEQAIARGLPRLVTFTKAYSGLTDEEFKRVDAEIRRHAVDKFGPVRSVVPTLVFELGFEGIARSTRHRSGVALRFPRMLRIRDDKHIGQADTLNDLLRLLEVTS